MAEPMDDEDNHSDFQGSMPRGVLAIFAIALFLHLVWLAWLASLAVMPIVMQAFLINKVGICKKKKNFRNYIPLFRKYNKHILDTDIKCYNLNEIIHHQNRNTSKNNFKTRQALTSVEAYSDIMV